MYVVYIYPTDQKENEYATPCEYLFEKLDDALALIALTMKCGTALTCEIYFESGE